MNVHSLSIKTMVNDCKTQQSSEYNSPCLISPPSSKFVSANQSPYISPRTLNPNSLHNDQEPLQTDLPLHVSLPVSSYSQSEDIPCSSYTPVVLETSDFDFSDDGNLKLVGPNLSEPITNTSTGTNILPRISFSSQVPRLSLARPSALNAKLRSCDVFIGYHGHDTNLARYCKWLKSELELQGIACFLADRARYADTQSHEIADRVICSVSFGIVVITTTSLNNPFSMEEVRFFAHKKNLIPMFFDSKSMEVVVARIGERGLSAWFRLSATGRVDFRPLLFSVEYPAAALLNYPGLCSLCVTRLFVPAVCEYYVERRRYPVQHILYDRECG